VSLRLKLFLGALAIAIAGLVAAESVVYISFSNYLADRASDTLGASETQILHVLAVASSHKKTVTPRIAGVLSSTLDPAVYAQLVTPGGQVVFTVPTGSDPPPDVARVRPRLAVPLSVTSGSHKRRLSMPEHFTEVGSVSSRGVRYLADVLEVPQGRLVVAVNLTSDYAARNNLLYTELIVGLLTAGALCAVLWLIVARGLAPLKDIARTSARIARGDLTERVRLRTPSEEIARVADALNGMLDRLAGAILSERVAREQVQRMVAEVSHEIRTPLTVLRGYAELLQRRRAAEQEVARVLDRIVQQVRRLDEILEDLFVRTQLEGGRSLKLAPLDISSLVAQVSEDFRVSYPAYPLELTVAGKAVVLGDERLLWQALQNLLRNVPDHNPPGTRTRVWVGVEDGSERVVVRIEDDGIGLASTASGQADGAGGRPRRDWTRRSRGLGLSIVSAVARAHGAELRVESEPGRGTSVCLAFPPVRLAAPPLPGEPVQTGDELRR
jgi:signal transduction histidine kinase